MKGFYISFLSLVFSFFSWSQDVSSTSNIKHFGFTKASSVLLESTDFSGSFKTVQGRVSLNDSLRVTGFDMVIDVNSLALSMEGMTKHAKSSDFFDVVDFPTITFFGGTVYAADSLWKVDGKMKAKGVELDKTIPFTCNLVKKGEIKIDAKFTIKRSEFGIGEPDAVSDEVVIHTTLFAKEK
jgi:polyisoprenoid-binding protein YceI